MANKKGVGNDVILYAEIPDLHVRKAVKVKSTDTVTEFTQQIQKKVGIDLADYAIYQSLETRSEIDFSLQVFQLKSKFIYFIKNRSKVGAFVTPAAVGSCQRIFGVPLNTLEAYFPDSIIDGMPKFLESAFQALEQKGLSVEGIFRISGGASQIARLKKRIDSNDMIIFENEDPICIAALIKLYLRELPEPLLTFKLFDVFKDIEGLAMDDDSEEKRKCIRACLDTLPKIHFTVLKRLLNFLDKVKAKSDLNLMTSSNLATVFGPNLLKPRFEESSDLITNAALGNSISMYLIDHHEILHQKSTWTAAQVLFDYSSSDGSELNLMSDSIVFVTDRNDDGWWQVWSEYKVGLFPENYLKLLSCEETILYQNEIFESKSRDKNCREKNFEDDSRACNEEKDDRERNIEEKVCQLLRFDQSLSKTQIESHPSPIFAVSPNGLLPRQRPVKSPEIEEKASKLVTELRKTHSRQNSVAKDSEKTKDPHIQEFDSDDIDMDKDIDSDSFSSSESSQSMQNETELLKLEIQKLKLLNLEKDARIVELESALERSREKQPLK